VLVDIIGNPRSGTETIASCVEIAKALPHIPLR
jgi:hypothetical protein